MKRWLPLLILLLVPALVCAQDPAEDSAVETAVATPDSSATPPAEEAPAPNPQATAFTGPDIWDTGVNPTGAVLMTPLFPGWGQLYTDNSWRAALAFGLEMFYWSNMIARDRRAIRTNEFALGFEEDSLERDFYRSQADENWEQVRDFAWWSGGVLLIIALDAYVGAHLFDFDEDPMPVPRDWQGQFGALAPEMPGTGGGPQLVVFHWGRRF